MDNGLYTALGMPSAFNASAMKFRLSSLSVYWARSPSDVSDAQRRECTRFNIENAYFGEAARLRCEHATTRSSVTARLPNRPPTSNRCHC